MRTKQNHTIRINQIRQAGFKIGMALAIAISVFMSVPVYALTPEERWHYANLGILFIDEPCDESNSDASIIGSINGSPDAKTLNSKYNQHVIDAFFFFLKSGFTAAQSAGIVGNLMVESTTNIDPTLTNSIGAHGIAQWLNDRRTRMEAWVAANFGGNKDSFIGQLNYIIKELKEDYSKVLAGMKKTKSPEVAAVYWNAKFEISGDTTNTRSTYARAVYVAATEPRSDNWSKNLKTPSGEGWIAAAGGTVVDSSNAACITESGSPNCANASGRAKILCEAKKYNGIYYNFGAGHDGYEPFKKRCSADVLATAAKNSTRANPGPCATDCSSLTSIALDDAYGKKYMWVVSDITNGGTGWKRINMSAAEAGDIVTVGDHHVEVVDHIDNQTKVIHTFGSHQTGTKTSASQASLGYYTQAWRWGGN